MAKVKIFNHLFGENQSYFKNNLFLKLNLEAIFTDIIENKQQYFVECLHKYYKNELWKDLFNQMTMFYFACFL